MAIYAIADLHLSFHNPKPMGIFGQNWKGHEEKLKKNWLNTVKEEDTVLLPGDFSWETYLEDTIADFTYLNSLPGKKLMLKGNHDYWWTSLTSMRKFLQENHFSNIDFIHNNSYCVEEKIITGTRGWVFTESESAKKIINREIIRLELSIQDGIQRFGDNKKIIVCMHYPPITKQTYQKREDKGFIQVMKKYPVELCIYGHLHGKSHQEAIEGKIEGIPFKLVSGDYMDFSLYPIA